MFGGNFMKKWIFAAAALMAMFAMVGCPSDSDDPPSTGTITTSPDYTVTGVTISGTSAIAQGGSATYTVTVDGTGNAGQKEVTWSLTVKDSGGNVVTPEDDTEIDAATGVLDVDASEADGNVIIVKATSDYDASISDTFEVTVFTVASLPVVTSVSITPTTAEIIKSSQVLTATFTPSVIGTNITGTAWDGVVWSVVKGSVEPHADTYITNAGVLNVAMAQANGRLTVKATAKAADGSGVLQSASAIVTVQLNPSYNVRFFDYSGGSLIKTLRIEEGITIDAAGLRMPSKRVRDPEIYAWKRWERANSSEVTENTSFNSDTDVFGTYYSAEITGDTAGAIDKVYLENATLAVYEFDLTTIATITDNASAIAAIKTLKGINASYMTSQAGMQSGTRLRVYGPYFFNGTEAITLTTPSANNAKGSKFWGDFKLDPNQKLGARHEGGASGPETFNKFQPYLINGAGDSSLNSTAENGWWTVAIPFDSADDGNTTVGSGTYSYGKTIRWLTPILDNDGKNGPTGIQVLPAGTDYTKVYFAIGLWRGNAGQSVNSQDSYWDHGRVFLVKDVELIVTVDGDGDPDDVVTGTVPVLTVPAHTQSKFEVVDDVEEETVENIPQVVTSQVFSGYIDPVIGSWRGDVNDPVVISHAPSYVPPTLAPAAADIEIDLTSADIKLFGNWNNADGLRIITKAADGTVSVNLLATDVSFGAGITFDIPDDYVNAQFDEIEVYYTAEIDGAVSGDRAQFATKAGRGTFSPNLSIVGGNAWPSIVDGDNKFRFVPANLGAAGAAGISFQLNTNAAENLPQKYTIKFTKVILIAP